MKLFQAAWKNPIFLILSVKLTIVDKPQIPFYVVIFQTLEL